MLSRSATPCCMRPHRCSCTRLARLPATAAYALQQQRQVRITAVQPLAPHSTEEAASKSIDEEIVAAAIAAEEQLQQQLRSLTLSVDATFKPLAAASAADVPPAPQQPQHHQQLQPQQQRSQQQRLSWLQQLTAKLPKFDGRFRGLVLLNVVSNPAIAPTMVDFASDMSSAYTLVRSGMSGSSECWGSLCVPDHKQMCTYSHTTRLCHECTFLAYMPLTSFTPTEHCTPPTQMTIIMASNWSVVKSSADAATMTDATTFMSMVRVLFMPLPPFSSAMVVFQSSRRLRIRACFQSPSGLRCTVFCSGTPHCCMICPCSTNNAPPILEIHGSSICSMAVSVEVFLMS